MRTLPPPSPEILQLRKLSGLVIEAQEAERRRIAADLHDSVNQLLSTVTFRIGIIAEQMSGANRELTEELEKVKLLLAKGIEEIHRISEGLRPSELDALGLASALRSLCGEFQEKAGLALNFDLELSPKRLPDTVELTLFRIIQEALNNIEKHSGASQATLRLKQNISCLQLTIRDNGRGLEPASGKAKPSKKKAGMGLLNMRERTAFLGGTFHIRSTADKGTEIVVRIPLTGPVPQET
jgi:two-component system NarL family sensor kinase